ncbi:MAG TPA: ATP synthase F1 subunit epsilon, partial [Rhizomicrobium sp.]|nr:ATP synthase F1 subunit epsilon [Rhizomicrobium sp.]
MADKIAFDLVSPERLLLSDTADMVTVPATEGYIGAMAGHAPVITTLRPGMIDISKDGTDTRFFVRGGFAEIGADKITVLAEEAVPLAEMDLAVL